MPHTLVPKITYTLPRKTEMHSTTSRLFDLKMRGKIPKSRFVSRRLKDKEQRVSLAKEEANQEESKSGSSCDEDELATELFSCFKHVTETVRDVDETQIINLEKGLQSSSQIATVNCRTLHSRRARVHARDHLLSESQQRKIGKTQAMEMMNTVTLNNVQVVDRDGKYSSTVSVAQQLATQHKRQLTASELLVLGFRNLWFDNLELRIGNNFLHVDRYLFRYFANAYADHNSPVLELAENEVSKSLMGEIYNWLINDRNELVFDGNFLHMYKLGKFLDIRPLLEQYWYNFAISEKFGFWEQNAFTAYSKAREIPCTDLVAILLSRIRKCFLPLVASTEFLEMKPKEVMFLFNLDTICVNSEDEVFFAAVRWLGHDWPRREKYHAQILSTIRMRMLSPWLQWSIMYRPENDLIRDLGASDQVRAMLWDACLFGVATVSNRMILDNSRNAFHPKYNQANQVQRFWVFCPGVAHHHDVNCPNFRKLTYRNFKLFLIRLYTGINSQIFMDAIKDIPQKHWNTIRCCQLGGMVQPKFVKHPVPSIYNLYDL